MPVHQYWSVTAYDMATHALIRDVPWGSRSSLTPGLQKNDNGSVDIYFGPNAPEGKESNWLPTKSGVNYELLFRFYGPEQAVFDKTWQLPDIEPMPKPNLFVVKADHYWARFLQYMAVGPRLSCRVCYWERWKRIFILKKQLLIALALTVQGCITPAICTKDGAYDTGRQNALSGKPA